MSPIRRKRMSPSIGYIGFGNRVSAFTHKPKGSFKKIKTIYRNEIKAFAKKEITKLSQEEKKKIRETVEKQLIKERKRNILIIISTVIISLFIIYLLSQ